MVTAWHLHVCSTFGTGDWQDWQDIERGQVVVIPAWQKLFDARLILEPEKATWFVVAGSNRIPGSLSHSSISKLKLSQLSILQMRHSSLICWPFAKMETVERMTLSQWSLLDTCMCALCLGLVIDVNWISARMPIELARLARHWFRASVCSSSMAKVVRCSARSRTGKGNVIRGSW